MNQIAIIMATYNGEQYLARQIESILENSYQNFILYMQDDGSTDNTFFIASEYAEKYPDKIHAAQNTKNKGVIRNFLDAAVTAEADYYMFCDQDDFWLENKIQKTLTFMQSQEADTGQYPPSPTVVFTDAKVVDAALRETAPSFQRQSGYRTDALDLPHLLMENKLIGCTMMFNRAARDKLLEKPFPAPIRMHDWWLALIGASFGRVAYLDEPTLLYRQHDKNIIGGSSRSSYLKDRISHLRRNREALYSTMAQGEAFLSIYGQDLSPEQRRIFREFAAIPSKNWFARRYTVLRFGFLKSGLARNMGILLVM